MRSTYFEDVKNFMLKFGQPISKKPQIPDRETQALRILLVTEEFEELVAAWSKRDLTEIADAGADLVYVILGMMASYGIPFNTVWYEVHRTNMEKEGGATREDGKIMKPEGWKPPNIKNILNLFGAEIP